MNTQQIIWSFAANLAQMIKDELQGKEELWLDNVERRKLYEQQHTYAINLRQANDMYTLDTTPSNIAKNVPITSSALNVLAHHLQGKPNRAMLVRLEPNKQVAKHIDGTADMYYKKCDRYHLIIHSAKGSPLYVENEKTIMHTGQLWWFDNLKEHWAENVSKENRTHLIFDLEPWNGICKRNAK